MTSRGVAGRWAGLRFQHAGEKIVEDLWDRGQHLAKAPRRIVLQGPQGAAHRGQERVGAPPRSAARTASPQAIDVGLLADGRGVVALLGRHELNAAQERAGGRSTGLRFSREAESTSFTWPAEVNSRFDGFRSRWTRCRSWAGLETTGCLADVAAGLGDGARTVGPGAHSRSPPVHHLHDEVGQAGHVRPRWRNFAGIEGEYDVGVVQLGQHAHLGVKSLQDRRRTVVVDRSTLTATRRLSRQCSAR